MSLPCTIGGSEDLFNRVCERLGLASPAIAGYEGLAALYRAWCERVPFDNVRKMIALRTGEPGPLPGGEAADFLSAWLQHGTGGTCWPSSNALFELVCGTGFDAELLSGYMRDLGVLNHATVQVTVGGQAFVIDSSMLTNLPLPLGSDVFDNHDPVVPAEVEREGDTHVLWFTMMPSPEPFPCRLQPEPVDRAFYLASYEASRERSPFNQRLYARRNHPGEVRVLFGNTRFVKSASGVDRRDLSRDELCCALRDDIGISDAMIQIWTRAGGLDASFESPAGPKPPAPTRLPPSRR